MSARRYSALQTLQFANIQRELLTSAETHEWCTLQQCIDWYVKLET